MTTKHQTPEHTNQHERPLGEGWNHDTSPGDPRLIAVATTIMNEHTQTNTIQDEQAQQVPLRPEETAEMEFREQWL